MIGKMILLSEDTKIARWEKKTMSKKKKKIKNYTPKKCNGILNASLDYIHDRIEKDLPYMYSAVALALWELVDGNEEEKYDAVMDMIQKSSAIWNDVIISGKDIVEECERITGICIRDEVC